MKEIGKNYDIEGRNGMKQEEGRADSKRGDK